jgi:superfamily II DNA or RNA helicase
MLPDALCQAKALAVQYEGGVMQYADFLDHKRQAGEAHGFAPHSLPSALFPFQRYLAEWAIRKGRSAIFSACGTGKTAMLLTFADNVVRETGGRVLILTPLAVGMQTVEEGEKFGIECTRSRDGVASSPITVTNYEQLHKFTPSDFAGLVCDESGCLKHMASATQKAVTRFALKIPYRLLCTATPAPNDYYELGTSSEALGYLGYVDMLTRFFKKDTNKRFHTQRVMLARAAKTGDHSAKLAYQAYQQTGEWRLKGHAEVPFWRWVCSWARACQMPSDLGFDDGPFILPPLEEHEHLFAPQAPPEGMLFTLPAFGLQDERDERRRTLQERCEYVAELVNHTRPAVVWVHLNPEGDLLEQLIPDAVQVKGSQKDIEQEARYEAFRTRNARVMITKPRLGGWGSNWQHCNHVVTFVTHSFESYYQCVRRCWRFGQTKPVRVDIVATEGERHVRENMARKARAADRMFQALTQHMAEAMDIARQRTATTPIQLPAWL